MADQLVAHCRLPRTDRRVVVVQPGTFALVEWGLDEDPVGLEGLIEPPPEGEPTYRGRERHPRPSRELARSSGRAEGGRGRRREEEERRGRRFPPPAEVAYEILAGAARPLGLTEIASQGAERLLMPDAFVRETASLRAALSEDNRRRESAGRKPLFQLDGETVTLVAQPEPGERPAAAAPAAARAPATAGELRRAALATLRRRLRECDGPTLEAVAATLLEKLGFRELKVAKRGREHVIYTGRRRMGLADLRHGIRIARNGADATRRDVTELRRDLGHYGAQLGVVLSAGDAARDARGEAGAPGQLPVVLLCGEALAEAFADAGVGTVPVVVPEVDEGFFRSAAEAAEKDESARRSRREERDRDRDRRERREEPREGAAAEIAADVGEPAPADETPSVEVVAELTLGEVAAMVAAPAGGEAELGEGDEDEDEGDEEDGDEAERPAQAGAAEGAAPEGAAGEGAASERRRRRRRRRRRGGRGRGREGAAPGQAAPAAGEQPQASAAAPAPGEAPPAEPPAPAAAPAAPPPAPASEPPGGGGEGGGAAA
jgi:hypothetical protein